VNAHWAVKKQLSGLIVDILAGHVFVFDFSASEQCGAQNVYDLHCPSWRRPISAIVVDKSNIYM
jgi:hypothetical protein